MLKLLCGVSSPMAAEVPKANGQPPRRMRAIWIVAVLGMAVAVTLGGVGAYSLLQPPNIQVTAVNFGTASKVPHSSTPISVVRVNGSATFRFISNETGTYVMSFDDTFDDCNDKSIALTYDVNGQSTSLTFGVEASKFPSTVWVDLNKSDTISIRFTVVGGTNDDVDFWMTGSACTASLPISFVLVNDGLTGGNVTVGVQSDGRTVWSNNYNVLAGQHLAEATSLVLPNCSVPQLTVVVQAQQKG
jgi:hypothetical protein